MDTNQSVCLQTAEYILLCSSFKEWLELLGYSTLSIPALAATIRDFLHWQEQNDKLNLGELVAGDANRFMETLTHTTGQRTGKPFSSGYLNKQIQALNLFSKYITMINECHYATPF